MRMGTRKPIDWTELSSNITRIWNKDMSPTIAVDLPRLVNAIRIIDTKHPALQPILDEHLTKTMREEKIKSLLLSLSKSLEDAHLAEQINAQFFDFIRADSGKEAGDIARDILTVWMSDIFINEVAGENTRVIRVLKACNQSIIAPAILQLKKNICPHLMYKDGGGWTIRVTISAEGVQVQHQKREKQMRTDGQKEDYEFEWQLGIQFNFEMDIIQKVEFHVTDLVFSPSAASEFVDDTKECFKDYLDGQLRQTL